MSTSVPNLGVRRPAGLQHLVVGTFTHSSLHILTLDTTAAAGPALTVTADLEAEAKHFWLALDAHRDRLYATSFTGEGAEVAVQGYQIQREKEQWKAEPMDKQIVASRSGYIALGPSYDADHPAKVLYSVGGPSGEVYALDAEKGVFQSGDGGEVPTIAAAVPGSQARVQEIDFLHGGRISRPGQRLGPFQAPSESDAGGEHKGVLAFGGLRHGSHSIDVGPVGPHGLRPVYVADIGRNSTFIYTADENGTLRWATRVHAPQGNDGPRHAWPHPNGRTVYVVEEHSSTVDVYRLQWNDDGTKDSGYEQASNILDLIHVQRLSILPPDQSANKFWADEVRTSAVPDTKGTSPRWLFASTRGLERHTKGYVALYELDEEGLVVGAARDKAETQQQTYVDLYQTPTSGGWANAIEPCPWVIDDGKSGIYAALTDGDEGLVVVLTVELQPASVSLTGRLSGSVSGQIEGSLTGHVHGNARAQDIVDNKVQNDVGSGALDDRFEKHVEHHEKPSAPARLVEVARASLGKDDDGKVRGAATAVWLA